MSNGTVLYVAHERGVLCFAAKRFANASFMSPAVRSALMPVTGVPSRAVGTTDSRLAKHTKETRTAAPSITHGSSDQASNMTPCSTIWSSTERLRPPRIELVATRPARAIFLSATRRPALSNQWHTRSASP